MDNVVKHLEMTQGVINRLASNSFDLKRLLVLLVVAALALASGLKDKTPLLMAVSLLVIVFWILDGYYLWQERLYRKLYDDIRVRNKTDYSMDTSDFKATTPMRKSVFSITIILFYATVLFVMFLSTITIFLGGV